ncbi:unnamed protein product [Amaranthus hypochondriacus]
MLSHPCNLKVSENLDVTKKLANVVVVENNDVITTKDAASSFSATQLAVVSMFSLSPTKLLLIFENELDTTKALMENSPMWCLFDEVRQWTEGEWYSDRVVWIELFGLHPKCWSLENIRKIGENGAPYCTLMKKAKRVLKVLRMHGYLLGLKLKTRLTSALRLSGSQGAVMYGFRSVVHVFVAQACRRDSMGLLVGGFLMM